MHARGRGRAHTDSGRLVKRPSNPNSARACGKIEKVNKIVCVREEKQRVPRFWSAVTFIKQTVFFCSVIFWFSYVCLICRMFFCKNSELTDTFWNPTVFCQFHSFSASLCLPLWQFDRLYTRMPVCTWSVIWSTVCLFPLPVYLVVSLSFSTSLCLSSFYRSSIPLSIKFQGWAMTVNDVCPQPYGG